MYICFVSYSCGGTSFPSDVWRISGGRLQGVKDVWSQQSQTGWETGDGCRESWVSVGRRGRGMGFGMLSQYLLYFIRSQSHSAAASMATINQVSWWRMHKLIIPCYLHHAPYPNDPWSVHLVIAIHALTVVPFPSCCSMLYAYTCTYTCTCIYMYIYNTCV